MQVCEKEMDPASAALLELEAEPPDPGAGIEHDDGSVVEQDLDAGRVPAVVNRVRPRGRHRTAAPPDRHAHADPTLFAPEDHDHADELVRMGEERKRGHGDLALDAVEARDPKLLVGGTPLVEGDSSGSTIER